MVETPTPIQAGELKSAAERRLGRVILIAAILMSLVAVASLILALINQRGLPSVFPVFGIALAAWISVLFIRRGRAQTGIWWIVGSVILASLALAIITEGTGILIALVSMAIISSLSSLVPSDRPLRPEIALGLLTAGVVIIYDLYGPALGDPGNPLLTSILTGIILVFSAGILLLRYPSFNLRVKLTIAALVISLVPFAVFSWINLNRLTDLLQSNAETELATLSYQTSLSLDNFIENNLNNVRTQAQLPGFSDYLSLPEANRPGSQQEANVSRALSSLLRSNIVFISAIGLVDLNGVNVIDAVVEEVGVNLQDQGYFREAIRTGLPYLSPVQVDPESGELSLYFAAPVRNAARQVVGIFRVRYRASVLQALLTSAVGRDTSQRYAVLVDDEYFIRLAHSGDPNLILKSYTPLEPDLAAQLQAEGRLPEGPLAELTTNQAEMVAYLKNVDAEPIFTTSAAALPSGSSAFTAVSRVRNAPWLVITRAPVGVVLAPIDQQARSSVTLALLTIVLVILVSVVGTQSLTAPITQLTQVAEQVATGDLSVRSNISSADEIGVLSRSFDSMTVQLQQILQGLEQRVAERTRTIELSADVSRRLSTILDPGVLVSEVVELLQSTFNYYHVHIYLLDESGEKLVMAGGTGEAGREMLQRGHSIPYGRGLVGRAAQSSAPVLVSDTQQDPDWLPNPLLPETRAELAVPIIFGEQVLGVLDVQQNWVEGLGVQDTELLTAVANQLAIALRNARQYEEAQRRAERESQASAIVRQIQQARTVESALQIAVRELGRALGTSQSIIRLGIDERTSGNPEPFPKQSDMRGGNGVAETVGEEQ